MSHSAAEFYQTWNNTMGATKKRAPDIGRALAPGGVVVLSGILAHQQRAVLAAYLSQGMALESRVILGDWPTLIMTSRSLM